VLKLGYHCGLRTSEVTNPRNFDTFKIRQAIEEAESKGEFSICLEIFGKGKKLRYVDFNPIITRDIKSFLEGRRSKIIDGPLICKDNGKPLSSSHATRVFKTARDISIVKIRKVINNTRSAANEYTVSLQSVKRLVFHSLRHTYATNLVRYCYKMKIDPWVYVRDQMGHERKETTEAYIVFEANIHSRDKIRESFSLVDEGT
jgi:integrase